MQWVAEVHGHKIIFYFDSDRVRTDPGLSERKRRALAAMHLLPIEHISVIVEPVIVADKFPGTRTTGGGWFPHASAWTTSPGVANTGVPSDEIRHRVGGNLSTGIVGITATAWLKNTNLGHNHLAYEYTVLHELGHSIDDRVPFWDDSEYLELTYPELKKSEYPLILMTWGESYHYLPAK